ncbi:MAG: response regulator [Gemmatimonadota bacterium]|nr:response regulator [Gemmatimonadota bacterium]
MEKKVLVLDDEKEIRHILKETFSLEGYTVVTAQSSEKALKAAKEENFPVMFVDLNLPGMDGVSFCREVKERNPINCIHAMSGFGIAFGLKEILDTGFDDYFIKPFAIKDLINAARYSFEKIARWESNKKTGHLSW